ncbi:MAG TPA: zinc ribbon domain-containing protein [Burkholderiales bacterium]|nr:zinc ribbon domain-containing protein [Burkholderiales bacterium]
MPIYEFECLTCAERFDRLQKLSDPDPDSCPHCGATGVRRRLTAPSFRLSGSGWYETDFKKDGDKKRNLVDKGEPAKSDAKSDATPAKPADGAASKPSESKSGDKSSSTTSPAPVPAATPASPAK